MSEGIRLEQVATNGITLEVAVAGPEDGPLVILLHGFPESWHGWRHQIGPLAEAGFRVVAPNQRGYGSSDKPRGIRAYSLDELAADVVGLLDSLKREQAFLVGHDWGGIVAWWLLIHHPGRFTKAAILNAPHPVAIQQALRADLGQIRRSWYTFAMQIPWLPEVMFRRRNFQALARALVNSSRPGTFSEADLDRYREGWSNPGAIRGMVNWYRAAFRARPAPPADPIVRVPTLMLWGARDRFLGRGLAWISGALCENLTVEWFEDATHWIQHEEPERVNQAIIRFFQNRA
jgi:pimeloyl-ACP methyl ester carboxylesterase